MMMIILVTFGPETPEITVTLLIMHVLWRSTAKISILRQYLRISWTYISLTFFTGSDVRWTY